MPRKKTHEEYLIEVAKVNPNIEVLETYTNAHIKILHKCKICSYKWMAAPMNLLQQNGECPQCHKNEINHKKHEKYVTEVAKINPNIEVLGQYVGNKTKILHKCKKCGYQWFIRPDHISKRKCPFCKPKTPRKTQKQYINEVKNINPYIEVIEDYIDSRVKIKHKCLIDGHEWLARPATILYGTGCPMCAKNSQRKTSDCYIKEVANINPNINVIGEYVQSHVKILHRCKICGYEWYATPHKILEGQGCPKCNDGVSYPNKFIYNFLEQLEINYLSEKSFDWSDGRKYDIYIPSLNCIIENHGEQHYIRGFDGIGGRTLKEEQKNDTIKKRLASSHQIKNYVVLDCRQSNKKWIKDSIMRSTLPNLLNFVENDIDWDTCAINALSSFVFKAIKLWEQGLSTGAIANKLKISKQSVENYLKKATVLQLCNYSQKESCKRTRMENQINNSLQNK